MSNGKSSQARQQRNTARFETGWDRIWGKKQTFVCQRCAKPNSAEDGCCCDECEEFMYEQTMQAEIEVDAVASVWQEEASEREMYRREAEEDCHEFNQ